MSESNEVAVTPPTDGSTDRTRRPALVLSALLLVAGLLAGLTSVVGVTATADGSAVTASTLAAFIPALPGLLALILALRRPSLGLAATAGGGVVGLVRLFADFTVLIDINAVTRPELFVETTDRARPLTASGGAWLLVAADALMLGAGIVAAIRLAELVGSNEESGPDDLFGAGTWNEIPPGRRDGPDETTPGDDDAVAVMSRPPPGRIPFNLPMLSVGFFGAVLLMVGALDIPYSGGYLGLPLVPIGSSLTGVVAAALTALVAAIVVVVAAALPGQIARALLAGTALSAAVPALTAVAAVLTGAPTNLSPTVWWTLAGAIVLAVSGLLARGGMRPATTDDTDGEPPPRWLTFSAGGLSLLAAACLSGASQTSLLNIDGAAPDDLAGAVLAPIGLPLIISAIPLAIAGVLTLVRPVSGPGLAAAAVVWAGAVYALGQALLVRSQVLESARNPLNADLPAQFQHTWTSGPGLWLGLIGTLLAAVAAVLAIVTSRRVAQSSLDVIDDASLDDSRAVRRWPAIGLAVVTVMALALPVYGFLGRAASSTLLLGYDLDTWGVWAVAIAACGALWVAALTTRPAVAGTLLLAAAAVVVQPLIIPAAIRNQPGFGLQAGFWCGIVVVVLLVAAAPLFSVATRRVAVVVRQPLAGLGPSGTRIPVRAESKGS